MQLANLITTLHILRVNLMTQFTNNTHENWNSSLPVNVRLEELENQQWNRSKAATLAAEEGIEFSDEHWAVITYLRKYYIEHGLSRFARTTSKALNQQFAPQGGSKYLYRLFANGPVTQGSRLANIRPPAGSSDASFGINY